MPSGSEWNAESVGCEGISIPAMRNFINAEEAGLNMIIHQIHNRGAGENWTYAEAVELLSDAVAQTPALISDYLDDFYQSNESRIG